MRNITMNKSVALVTGASRGVGRGIAITLVDAGFTVFATGRNIDKADLPSSVIRIKCDHLHDEQTAAAFERIRSEAGQLDLLVNAAWSGYDKMVEDGKFTWPLPFWEQPSHRWTGMIDGGVRAAYVASSFAARMMIPKKSGLIVSLSYWAAQKYLGNTLYGISKAATDKLSADMAHELKPHGIAAISLYPGLVRTEAVLEAAKSGWLDLSNSESPEFIGRVIAALTRNPTLMERTGKVLVAAKLANELQVTDIDGKQPLPLTLQSS